jgi:hypothetical protein
VEVANILLAVAGIAFVISPPFDTKSPVNVVIPVTSRVVSRVTAPEAVRSVTVVAPAPNVPVVTTF